jgi:hypothetical protein
MSDRKKTLPDWDAQRRKLRFGRRLVKHFARPAKNQELILAAFGELGWPERIDNPPGGSHKRAHEHLRDSIKRLNRGQNILCFHADGTGEGIRWEVARKARRR